MSQADLAYRNLRYAIVEWQVEPGAWLTESELQELSGFARTPTREAAGRLIADGLLSVMPRNGYPVPTDGPGGEWLRATGRQPMRPAHIHARVDAGGYRTLITHLFVAGDPYLDVDAAFGVRDGLVLDFDPQDDPAAVKANDMPGPYYNVSYDLVLVPDPSQPADP
jgi:protocatechuate 3,4-dioxygenase beta subunit